MNPFENRTLYRALHYGLQAYIACLAVFGLYSVLWLAEIAGHLERTTVGVIWLGIAGMGALFLVLLVPVFLSSRTETR